MDPTMLLVLGIGGIFVAGVLVLISLGVGTTERQAVGRSLAAIDAIDSAPSDLRAQELQRPFTERVVKPTTAGLAGLGRRITPVHQADGIKRRLALAGNPEGWTVDRVLATKFLGLVILGALGLLLPWLLDMSLLWRAVIGIGAPVLGYFLPNILLKNSADKRAERIQRELPDTLDMLTISVEAGLAFDAALSQVARNTEGPLAEELFRVLSEMQIGLPRNEALRGLADRTEVEDVRSFVSAMTQADTFGIPISNVLRVQSEEMRIKRRQRAEERAQKVPVKILFPVIFCIFPVLFVVLLGPAAIQIFRTLLPTLGG
jgi:tight adherence protein C